MRTIKQGYLDKYSKWQCKCFKSIQLPMKGSNFNFNRYNAACKKFRELYSRGLSLQEIISRMNRFGGN